MRQISNITMTSDVHEVYRTADTYHLCIDSDNGSSLEKANEGLAYRFMHHGLTFTPGGNVADAHNAANDTVITMLNMLAMVCLECHTLTHILTCPDP
jgi:hypothetical protein